MSGHGVTVMTARPLKNITRETLAPLWAREDIPTERIAKALGVTRQAVSSKARTLGLPSRAKVRKQLCNNETFRRMWLAGVNSTEMAQHFGYSHRSAIGSRAGAMGLPRRARSTDTGKTGGWVQTISLAQFFEQDLRNRMEAEAKKREASK